MKTKFLQPNLKLMLSSVAIVALLAASFVTVYATAKAKPAIHPINAPAMAPVIDATAKATQVAKEAAEMEAQKASAVAGQQPAFQASANAAIKRLSDAPRTPRVVTCGAGNVRVEATNSGNDADYATLADAFTAINAGTHTGTVMIGICNDTTEPVGGASLTGAGGYTSVTITPSGARTVSAAVTAGSPLINLNGATNVTIDGLNTGGNSLTISNTTVAATAGTSTIRLINGAQNNTITNCSVLGSSTASTTVAGGNILISTSTGGANSSNTISNNNIGPAGANLPTKGVMSLGTASPNNNTGNIIDNNNIFDFFQAAVSTAAGISLQANTTNATVSNNRIYQTAPRTFTVSATYSGILCSIGTGAGTATITGNTIGFGAANGTGTTSISGGSNIFVGLNLTSSSTVTGSSIQNNTISGIVQSTASTGTGSGSAFRGIYIAAGRWDVGNITGNQIGSLDGSSTITFTESSTGGMTAIYDFTSSSNTISNNRIGAITINGTGTGTGGFRAVLFNTSSAATATLNNNQIGGSGAGGITDSLVGGYAMYAVQNSLGVLHATGNTIQNISGNSNLASTIVVSGMILSSTSTTGGPNIISQNVIHSLSNNSGTASNSIYALYGSFPSATANVVERNFVHSLSITSTATTCQLVGILPVAGTGTYKNNMVSLGIDAAGNSISTGYQIYGMFEIAGANNLYFNSVYLGGTGVADASNTFGFVSNVTSGARSYIDNIFWNARSNGVGTGKHYAIALSGPGFTSNYNDLYASGTGGFVGLIGGIDQTTLANWQTASGQDANSISTDSLFVNANGDATMVNLHLMPGSPCIAMATPITGITTDFDNDMRQPCTPDIGADEQTSYGGPAIASVTISKLADAATVNYGNQVGFVVKLTNTTANTALGLAVSDNLPAAPGVDWMIDAGATDPGWSVVGAPPSQSLQYSPSTLAGNAMTQAHVVSATTVDTCGSTLNNTASFSITNGCPGAGSGMASASISVVGQPGSLDTLLSQDLEGGFGSWTAVNNSVGGTNPSLVIWTLRPTGYVYSTDTFTGNSGTMFIMANSDMAGSGVTGDTSLISPSFSAAGYSSVTLTFKHYLRWLATTVATVGISTDGGTTWTTVQTYNTATVGSAAAFANASINLNAYAGQPNLMVRFRYQSGWDWYWAVDDILVTGQSTLPCPTPTPTPPMVVSAVSAKTHGGAGTFNVDLPLTGSPGIECRSGGLTNDHTIVVTFDGPVAITGTPQAELTAGTGCVGTGGTCDMSGTVSISGNTVTIPLTNVTNAQVINVRLNGVNTPSAGVSNDVTIPMRVLLGDTNGDTQVDSSDITQTKSRLGQTVDGTTFRSDVNVNGSISSADVSLVKSQSPP